MSNIPKRADDCAAELFKHISENLNPDLTKEFDDGHVQKIGRQNFEEVFTSALKLNARRVGPENHEDLSAWVFLECLEHKRSKGHLTPEAVISILSRIRHRIVRQERRAVHLNREPAEDQQGDSAWKVAREFLQFASDHFTPLHVSLFEGHFLDNKKVEELAAETGLSKATAYRMIREVKIELLRFLNADND
jgi:hypothetical protein